MPINSNHFLPRLFIVFIFVLLGCNQATPTDGNKSNNDVEIESNNNEEEQNIDYSKFGIDADSQNNLGTLTIGNYAPDFSGKDQFGNEFILSETLKDNQVLLIFYRGYWCPYCTKYLALFTDQLETLQEKGVQIIAVSPESPMYVDQTRETTNLEIPFISDSTNSIMTNYGVTFKVTNEYNDKITNWKGVSIGEINNQEEAFLPIPATYIIGKDGKIKWVHFDPNYKNRPSVEEIINNL